ncbi:MAG: hypothetical protein ABIR60_08610 [Allosphingosinicella sp.]
MPPKKKPRPPAPPPPPVPEKARRRWRDTPTLDQMTALRSFLEPREGEENAALEAMGAIVCRLRPVNHGQGGPPRWPDLELLDEARALLAQVLPWQFARHLRRRD